ncbi:hypothetical protein MHO82_06875 [Vibrio sp. Of7-15]|uniref:hypothetical protein n=1 Tax=Vibrio sp. Of7-15 TaxID=2724879 RepID=UPI001EF2938D|nr:hypothetical protein [Vibrio sp. Of7-15]MCG7496579.1 hypothetical protein [Vibrio sp. Of7-15]
MTITFKGVGEAGLALLQDAWKVYITLLKVMVPALIVVKALDMVGGTEWLAQMLSPLMQLVGLPEQMGLVWATAILTNIYTALVVFFDVAAGQDLSVADVSVLGILLLVAHSLPIEGAVAKMTGVSWRITVPLRLVGGFVLAAIVNQVYQAGDWQQQPAVILWQPEQQSAALSDWVLNQASILATIFFIIAGLMLLLRVLRLIGIEALMQKMLSPLLRSLTIGKEATNVTIIGLTLGLSFGAGLLIDEAKSGNIGKRDILLSVCFLGLAHSLIEDTLLILLIGADITSILWGRLLFAIVVIAAMARLVPRDTLPVSKVSLS